MLDDPEMIEPAEAFRLFLCARYRRVLKFADRIDADWLTYSKRLGIPSCVKASAESAIKRLRQHVKDYDIRLRGKRVTDPHNPIIWIGRIEQKEGELDVFEQTLGHGIDPAHTVRPLVVYTSVHCVKSDVMKIVEEISKESFSSASVVPGSELRPAPSPVIRKVIAAVYDDADRGEARPNINQLCGAVQPRLAALGYKASGREIKRIGKEFSSRRNEVGSGHSPSSDLTVSK